MGVMNSMRANMSSIMIGLVVVFVITMTAGGLVGGADIMDLVGGNNTNVFTQINGETISYDTYTRAVQRELDSYKERSGNEADERVTDEIMNQTWETMISQVMIKQDIADKNIRVSDEELKYYFVDEIHPMIKQYFVDEQGAFDRVKYDEAVNAPEAANFFNAIHDQLASIIPIEKLQKRIYATASVSDADIRLAYERDNLEFDLDYFFVKSSMWKDDEVTVSDAAIAAYYQEHKDDFFNEETRIVKYVSLPVEATTRDSQKIFDRISGYKTDIENGQKFEEFAALYSDDPSGTNGGYLGWFGKGRMVPPFEEAAFTAKLGDIVGPVKTRFGYHIIRVENKRNAADGSPEIEARHVLLNINPSESTRNEIRRSLRNFGYLAEEMSFEAAADSAGLESKTSTPFKYSDSFISGLGQFKSAIRFAFRSDLNTQSSLLQNQTQMAIFQLNKVVPEGARVLEDVKKEITSKIRTDEKNKFAKTYADSILQTLTPVVDFARITCDRSGYGQNHAEKVKPSGYITGLGRYENISGFLSSAKEGQLSPVLETPRGSVIIRLNTRKEIVETAYKAAYANTKASLITKAQETAWNTYLSNLKEKSKIIDNRVKFL